MADNSASTPEWLTVRYIETVLKGIFNFRVQDIQISAGAKAGDGFSSQVLRINVQGENNSVSVIGKLNLDKAAFEKFTHLNNFFLTEFTFFTTLLPKLDQVNAMKITPNYYATDLDRGIIFMEDLSSKGYKMMPRGQFLDLDHCKLSMDVLATFHGSTYQALEKTPSLKETYKDLHWSQEKIEPAYHLFLSSLQSIKANIDKYGLSESQKTKLLGIREKVDDDWFKVMEPKEEELNVLIHGDSWSNNFLYRYEDGKLDSIKLIDFQIITYGCFANDLSRFFFNSADLNVLLNHLDYLLKRYYKKLRSVAPGIPNLTLERVKKEFADRHLTGLIITLIFRSRFNIKDPAVFADENTNETGNDDPQFIADLQKLFPFFESLGVI